MEKKFNILDLVHLYDVIHTLRKCTAPVNEHTDPLSNEDCWNELYDLVDHLAQSRKEDLFDKESLEKIVGKQIQSYKKEYDENGVLKGITVIPIAAVEYINCNITILPSGEATFTDVKEHN